MTLQDLQTQIRHLPISDRLKLINMLVQSLQQDLQPSDCPPSRSLVQSIGTAQGSFATPIEADRFIRQERDAWES